MFRGCRTLGFHVREENANSASVGPHAPVIRGNIVALTHYCCRCTRGCVGINALHRVGGVVGEHSRTHDHSLDTTRAYLVVELRRLYVQPRQLSALPLLVQDEPREIAHPSRLFRREFCLLCS